MRYGAALSCSIGLCVLLLTGCQGALQGRPDFPGAGMLPPETQNITEAAALSPTPVGFDWSTDPNCQKAIADDNAGTTPTDPNYSTYVVARNNCIYEFLGAIDYQYDLYKEGVFKLANGLNASADTVTTVLSAGAAGVAGNAGRVLSGISAGIGTLKGTINQDVLYNQTITTIIAAMDADRADALKTILQQMNPPSAPPAPKPKALAAAAPPAAPAPAAPPAAAPAPASAPMPYTMYAASVDLLAYFEAGTVHHAIVGLQSTSGAKAVSCQAAVKDIKTTGAAATGTNSTTANQAAGCS